MSNVRIQNTRWVKYYPFRFCIFLCNLPVSHPQTYHDAALEIAKISFSLRQNSGKEWSLEEITAQFWSDYFGSKEILETAEAIAKRELGINDPQ